MYRKSVVVTPSCGLTEVLAELAVRAQRVRAHIVDPQRDSLSRILADQRAAVLDLRLLGRPVDRPGKVEVVSARVAELQTGGPEASRTGLQILYADLGAPVPGRWSLVDELHGQLTARGIPGDGIRYLHQARSDAERAALLDDCRSGRVGVLIANSRRMPPDLPAKAHALHHLDCPLSLNDLRRREGHAAPDGPRVYRYITAGSYEIRTWRALEVAAAQQPERRPAARAFPPLTSVRTDSPVNAATPAAVQGQHLARNR